MTSFSKVIPDSVPRSPSTIEAIGATLGDWLVTCALPLWSTTGVDQTDGGFHEMIDLQGRPVEAPRRARVVARQIYVFATAARNGWLASADSLVDHGLRFLLQKMRQPDGTVASAVDPRGGVLRGEFDLYEHAFVLFALASACEGRPDRAFLAADAETLLQTMRNGWRHPLAGFEESAPRTLPLRSNPHMHLLEAALAWMNITDGASRRVWQALADELVELCLDRFIDQRGALHEYFDEHWRPLPGLPGRVVEPGHQFEWGWLLMRWATATGSSRATSAATTLIHLGEAHGVDERRGVAINAIDQDFQQIDRAAKLWPQTERVKAWHWMARFSAPGQTGAARDHLVDAVRGLSLYLLDSPRGLWHEQLGPHGQFDVQHCRASSLYHIVCAIDVFGPGKGNALPALDNLRA